MLLEMFYSIYTTNSHSRTLMEIIIQQYKLI
jgi:hypothetical protein